MRELHIGDSTLMVKDYHCAEWEDFFSPIQDEEYILKKECRLWLYVNLTDKCNAACPFCINKAASKLSKGRFNTKTYEEVLGQIIPYVYGISFTGGEPMLDIALLEEVLAITDSIAPPILEVDVVTNGTNISRLPFIKGIERFSTIHISRHAVDDARNRDLMQWNAPSAERIAECIKSLKDPGAIVFNCVLQKGGVEKIQDIYSYLDFAIETGVHNSSFIEMIRANGYCEDQFVSAMGSGLISELRYSGGDSTDINGQFRVWNRFRDYEYCHCLSGDYRNNKGITRFYFRCPGKSNNADYCRQLVYTAENILQDGFGNNRMRIFV